MIPGSSLEADDPSLPPMLLWMRVQSYELCSVYLNYLLSVLQNFLLMIRGKQTLVDANFACILNSIQFTKHLSNLHHPRICKMYHQNIFHKQYENRKIHPNTGLKSTCQQESTNSRGYYRSFKTNSESILILPSLPKSVISPGFCGTIMNRTFPVIRLHFFCLLDYRISEWTGASFSNFAFQISVLSLPGIRTHQEQTVP